MNVGNLFRWLVDLFFLYGGVFIILLFNGKYHHKFKSEKDKESFNVAKEKHGKKMIAIGCVLILITLVQIAMRFF